MYWHQDFEFLPNELPAAFDLEAFCQQTPFSQIQWNLALFDDTALMVVPGTHRQALSPKQREVLASSGQKRAYIESMPGALRVELKAGDGVAYNSNIVHGVDNPRRVKRRTLHWFWVIWGDVDPYNFHRSTFDDEQRELISSRLCEMADAS